MYDDIYAANVPANGDLYAGYDDGHWPDAADLQKRFPGKRVVRVTAFPTDIFGDVLDVETGDAKPTDVPAWLTKRRAQGGDPSIYCSEFSANGIAAVEAACKSAGVHFDRSHWWRANYNGHALLESGESAHQWRDVGPYDSSVVADYWPGIDPVPVTPTPIPTPVPLLRSKKMIFRVKDGPLAGWEGYDYGSGIKHLGTVQVQELVAAGVPVCQISYATYQTFLTVIP